MRNRPQPVTHAPAGAAGPGRPLRLALFSDTVADVNGVSRFVRSVASLASAAGRNLRVFTSTNRDIPAGGDIRNFAPLARAPMPGYPDLDLVLPPVSAMLREGSQWEPDVVHISTPGPVGLAGRLLARRMGVPALGVYHTDFPAYVERLFEERAATWAASWCMRRFYRPFARVFTRSDDYRESVAHLGVERSRLLTLLPGVDTEIFHPRFANPAVWDRLAPCSGAPVRVLYVGRVSVEKNLPFLTRAWESTRDRLRRAGVASELILVGDGPYRAEMEQRLSGRWARFLGFRHGEELSAIYASSDLFVFPSTTDTLGQVVMESQASGLPVLVTDRGGPKEVVTEGLTGHVLSADDPDAWVEAIVRLCADHALRRRMGEAAHSAMRGLSIQRSFENFWEAHEEAWRERRQSPGPRSEIPTGRAAAVGAAG